MAQSDAFELSMTVGNSTFSASGPVKAVMDAFGEFKALLTEEPAKPADVPAKEDPPGAASVSGPTQSSTTGVPLAQFVGREDLKGNAQIATAIVAWAADRESKASLTIPEIRDYWSKKTSIKLPQNLGRDVRAAAKKGWLEQSGDGYSASGYGRKTLGLT